MAGFYSNTKSNNPGICHLADSPKCDSGGENSKRLEERTFYFDIKCAYCDSHFLINWGGLAAPGCTDWTKARGTNSLCIGVTHSADLLFFWETLLALIYIGTCVRDDSHGRKM